MTKPKPNRRKLKPTLSHQDLVDRAEQWVLKQGKCGFALSEFNTDNYSGEIPDVLGFRYQRSTLIECKVTRGDFLSDKNKKFRKMPTWGMGNLRYFMTPPGLVTEEEVLDRYPNWGLLVAHPKIIKVALKPREQICSTKDERIVLCSALRRVHLRDDLSKIYDVSTLER
jgi:hypothetical protein